MKFANRFAPVAAIGIVLAVFLSLIAASGAGNSADNFAIDLDTTGNTATTLGTRDECREVTANSDVTIDVTATNIPAATPMIAFNFGILYNSSAISVIAPRSNAGLLSTAPGYNELDTSDALPDTDGAYNATVVDITAGGVSGTGFLQRLTLHIAAGAPAGAYALTLDPNQTSHVDTQSNTHVPDALLGARLAVGVTCASLGTPTPTPAPIAFGDVDCSGGAKPVNAVDALKILRKVAGLSVQQAPNCPHIGDQLPNSPYIQGDVDCTLTGNAVTAVDALKILRFVAGLSVQQPQGCPHIGT